MTAPGCARAWHPYVHERSSETDTPLQVLEYCSHHRADAPPPADDAEESRKRTTDISEWDAKFIQVDQGACTS
jgi:hypothetical protein